MTKWTPRNTLIVAGVAVVGLWYFKTQTVKAVKAAGRAVSPTNHENIFNQSFNEIYQGATGSENSMGSDLYDFFHGE